MDQRFALVHRFFLRKVAEGTTTFSEGSKKVTHLCFHGYSITGKVTERSHFSIHFVSESILIPNQPSLIQGMKSIGKTNRQSDGRGGLFDLFDDTVAVFGMVHRITGLKFNLAVLLCF